MNIIEAVKSGKPIRRASWWDCLTVQAPGVGELSYPECLMFPDHVDPKLTVEDILADDWVIGPRSTVSTSQFFKGAEL